MSAGGEALQGIDTHLSLRLITFPPATEKREGRGGRKEDWDVEVDESPGMIGAREGALMRRKDTAGWRTCRCGRLGHGRSEWTMPAGWRIGTRAIEKGRKDEQCLASAQHGEQTGA